MIDYWKQENKKNSYLSFKIKSTYDQFEVEGDIKNWIA